MAMLDFNSSFYLQQNPDVAFAISRGVIASAEEHFNTYGRFEGRNPNAYFDVTYYLTANPDVAAARVNPLEHFLTFGAEEGRFANATADAAIDTDGNNLANEFDAAAYLAANADVAANVGPGKTYATAYEHYVLFGQFETRTGVPANGPFTNTGIAVGTGETFTLTTGLDNLIGTNGNDTFRGDIANLGAFDSINGLGGTDTLNLIGTGGVDIDANATIQGVEIVNIATTSAITNLSSDSFQGVQQIWQVGGAIGSIEVGAGVTAGFRGGALAGTVTVQDGVTSVTAALEKVTTGGTLAFAETTADDLTSVSVSGDVAGAGALTIDTATGTTAVETINLNLSSDGDVTVTADADVLTTLNAASSTGDLTLNLGATYTALTSLTTGAGADTVTFSTAAGTTASAIAINLGAGNDTLTFTAVDTTDATAVSITLGAGNDTFVVAGLTNITDATKISADLVTVTDFTAGADVLDLSALGPRDIITNAEQATISAATDLAGALTAAAAVTTGYSIFNYGGDAYVFNNSGTSAADFDAGDGLMKLAGVQVSDFTAQNLVVA